MFPAADHFLRFSLDDSVPRIAPLHGNLLFGARARHVDRHKEFAAAPELLAGRRRRERAVLVDVIAERERLG